MTYLAASEQKGEGLVFRGKTHVAEGFCMFLCKVCRGDVMDRELSEYVWRRLKHWAQGHKVTEKSPVELEQLLTELQEELDNYGQIQKSRGRKGEIRWIYLTLLLCTGELALITVRGQGQVQVCQKCWGKSVGKTLLDGGTAEVLLVRLESRVGVLMREKNMPVASCWPEVLDPVEIRSEKQLQKRLGELGKKIPAGGDLAYMIYIGE